jgi:Ca-activated chloride channel family protein
MELFFSQFHLIRPVWLLGLIPAIILFVFLLKRRLASARWNGIIDKSLMPHVLDQMPSEQSRWPLWFILLSWIVASIALAGPTWQQLPQVVQKKEDALVIVLDMSLSMAAQDVSPDRATRARQKIIDILKQRKEGLTALVVYAGDAYTVTPLTDDADTAINLVPALSPFIMPSMGSRPDKALILARKLITDAGLIKADYLLVTDGIQKKDVGRIKKALGNQTQQLSVLTLGTEEGAPIPMQGKGFKRDKSGNIVLPKLDLDTIKLLANELGIRWHQMTFDDRDWHYLLQVGSALDNLEDGSNFNSNHKPLERQFDLWEDQGYWLIFIIIIIAAFSFRRGWMLSLVFMISLQPEQSYAGLWDDAWQTKDQQGQKSFAQNPSQAAELFENPNWKASSLYRAGEYEKAAENFLIDSEASPEEQAISHYNRGNAFAQSGKLEEAIKDYEEALELNIKMNDAHANKALAEKLLEQQEEEEQQNQDQDQDQDEKSDDSESSDNESDQENEQESDQDSKEQENEQDSDSQQNSESKDSEEQDSEEQDSEEQDSEEQDSEEQDSDKQDSEEKDAEQDKSDKQDAEQAEADKEPADGEEQQGQASPTNPGDDLSEEEKQALEQWLNRIPDDPGGLLKRKFLYQYKQRDHQDEGEVSW